MRATLLCCACAVLASPSAWAADLPAPRVPIVAVPPPIVSPWTGFYAGVNAGANWSSDNTFNHIAAPGFSDPFIAGGQTNPNFSGTLTQGSGFAGALDTRTKFIGGGQLGYNRQFATVFVAGLEADIQGIGNGLNSGRVETITVNPNFPTFPEIYDSTFTRRLSYFGTVRGRLGYAPDEYFLFYATGGFAYGGVRSTTLEFVALNNNANGQIGAAGNSVSSLSRTKVGYTVGGGAEVALTRNISFKTEYLFYDLGRLSYASGVTQPVVVGATTGRILASTTAVSSTRINGNIIRVGLNYHFSAPAIPVVARY